MALVSSLFFFSRTTEVALDLTIWVSYSDSLSTAVLSSELLRSHFSASCRSWASQVSVNLSIFSLRSWFSLVKCSWISFSASIFFCVSFMAASILDSRSSSLASSSLSCRSVSSGMLVFFCSRPRQSSSSLALEELAFWISMRQRVLSWDRSWHLWSIRQKCSSRPLQSSMRCASASCSSRILSASGVSGLSTSCLRRSISFFHSGLEGRGRSGGGEGSSAAFGGSYFACRASRIRSSTGLSSASRVSRSAFSAGEAATAAAALRRQPWLSHTFPRRSARAWKGELPFVTSVKLVTTNITG
mmetsp:Transcript_9383/g.27881  ORF Transcript_9383/g.27881 Transcript_9383/m.27881 type:complete len:301 (-) Transcript_9383:17-919(-)